MRSTLSSWTKVRHLLNGQIWQPTHPCVTGHKETSEFDDQIAAYRARFELIIKTEGENSTSGTGYAPHPGPNYHANSQPMGQQGMPGGYGGRGFQSVPQGPQAGGQLSEKQWKNEKALGGMV